MSWETSVYIKSLDIVNVRGLPPIKLDLKRPNGQYAGMTVVAGPNGSGKTSLLQAIALATYGDDVNPFNKVYWLKHGQKHAAIRLDLDAADEGFESQVFTADHKIFETGTNEYRPESLEDGLGHEKGWLLLGYGPLRRLGNADEEATKLAMNRVQTLMKENHTLTESVRWLKDINHMVLEGNAKAKTLQDNLLELLKSDLLPGMTPVKISSKGLEVEENGITFVLNQLSDGYRTVIAVIMDMVRQMDQAFKGFQFKNGKCPHSGVVLIDEIDTHLHPSWQQKIGFWLKEHFPKVQFIVTTHSPFICQSADPKGLIRLNRESCDFVSDETYRTVTNGSIDQATLSELFGLEHSHSQTAEDLRQELAKLDAKLYQGTITEEEAMRREEIMNALPRGGGEVQRLLRKFSEV